MQSTTWKTKLPLVAIFAAVGVRVVQLCLVVWPRATSWGRPTFLFPLSLGSVLRNINHSWNRSWKSMIQQCNLHKLGNWFILDRAIVSRFINPTMKLETMYSSIIYIKYSHYIEDLMQEQHWTLLEWKLNLLPDQLKCAFINS